jgi:hypothetical protein
MKVIIIFLIIIFGFSMLLSVSNPTDAEFNSWYIQNIEIPIKKDLNDEINKKLSTGNETLQILIDGAYKIFAKDTVNEIMSNYLDSIRENVIYDRQFFYSNYTIPLPDGNIIYVKGYLNSFHVVPSIK